MTGSVSAFMLKDAHSSVAPFALVIPSAQQESACNVTRSVLRARSAVLPQEQRPAAAQVHSMHS